MESVITPVNAQLLGRKLKAAGYDTDKTKFLVDGFMEGFDLQYNGPSERTDTAKNIPFTVGDKFQLWEKVMKEVAVGRFAGPFDTIPFKNYIQSPIGLVPKANDQTCLVFHLSYTFPRSGNPSVNECTPRKFCSVKYNDLDHAIQGSLRLLQLIGGGQKVIWYGKSDIKSAFRLLPLKFKNYWMLVMTAENPKTGKWVFFVDKCLPFRHSISCALFQKFSDGLAFILEHEVRISTENKHLWIVLTNYLDDFLFAALSEMLCNQHLRRFLQLCAELGVPVA